MLLLQPRPMPREFLALFLAVLSGAVLTETVFAYPGIGTWLVEAIKARNQVLAYLRAQKKR